MRATFICVTHNSEAHFPDVYDSCKAAVSGDTEFIVVDNASSNGTSNLKADRLLEQNENLWFTKATNIGLKASQQSDFYVIVNPDIRLEPQSLDTLFREMTLKGAAIAGAVLVFPNLVVQHGGGLDYLELSDKKLLRLRRKAHKNANQLLTENLLEEYPCYSRWVTGALMVVSHEAFKKLGFLDERYVHYHSDLEYCLRASEHGMKVITSSVVALHMHRASVTASQTFAEQSYHEWLIAIEEFYSESPKAEFVTSFNTRIFKDSAQLIYDSFVKAYPKTTLHIYHENSYDQTNLGESIQFKNVPSSYVLHDIFEEQPWLDEFLKTSPLSQWKSKRVYWNRNAIFWFRKVAAIEAALRVAKHSFLIWLDADCSLLKSFSKKLLNYAANKDVCCVLRNKNRMRGIIDSGVLIFNLTLNGARVIQDWMEWYRSGMAFKERRWDDGYIFTQMLAQLNYAKVGGLTMDFGSPVDIWTYVWHSKHPLRHVRDKERPARRILIQRMCEQIEEKYTP